MPAVFADCNTLKTYKSNNFILIFALLYLRISMKKYKKTLWGLALLSSVLMSVPFLVPHCGFFALFGLVPLLCMERIATLQGERRIFIYHYASFVLWNALTTFWVCNATVGGGIFAVLANALQMSVIFALFRLSKRHFKGVLPYIFLAALWIAWERAYFDFQISWPWLVLGNAFAGSTGMVQWYEYTGSLGGSLWIWACNLGIFGMMTALSDGTWNAFNIKAKIFCILSLAVLFIAPPVWSAVIYNNYEEKENPLQVLVVQPNIDPYNKFVALGQQHQNAILEDLMKAPLKKARASADTSSLYLVLAPETFTSDVCTNDIPSSRTWRRFVTFLKDYPGVNMIFGASSYSFIDSVEAPSHTARKTHDGRWMETHNSALVIDGTGRTDIFHKSKLVVAVEMTPFPALFCKIDDLLGGVMGRCIGQDEISLLECVSECDSVNVGCAVCYESVYGEYCTGYVRKGAEVLTVITNDAWWGDTPGYRQHLRYACLRAIETRRSIARCANTGISAFIDQRGNIIDQTQWWEPAVLEGSINRNDKLTFFVRHGDVTGRICTFVALLLAAYLVIAFLKNFGGRKTA